MQSKILRELKRKTSQKISLYPVLLVQLAYGPSPAFDLSGVGGFNPPLVEDDSTLVTENV